MSLGDAELDPIGGGGTPVGPPRVRFGAIGEGWDWFTDRWGTWVLTVLIVLACNTALAAGVAAVFGGEIPLKVEGFRIEMPPEGRLAEVVLSAVLNGFFLGGMFRMACRQVRGLPISVGDFFGVTDVLQELTVGAAIYAGICALAYGCFVLPAFVASGVLMFTFPLIVDARLSGQAAVRESWNSLKPEWLPATLFHLTSWFIAGLGACCFGCGIAVTGPLYCLSIACLYRDFFVTKAPAPGPDYGKPAPPDPDY